MKVYLRLPGTIAMQELIERLKQEERGPGDPRPYYFAVERVTKSWILLSNGLPQNLIGEEDQRDEISDRTIMNNFVVNIRFEGGRYLWFGSLYALNKEGAKVLARKVIKDHREEWGGGKITYKLRDTGPEFVFRGTIH